LASKKNRTNWVIPVFIMAVLLVGIGFINRLQNPPPASPPPPPPPPPAATASAKPSGPPGAAAKFTAAPEDVVINNPATAKTRLELGWEYDPTVQAHPEQLQALISMLIRSAQASGGQVSFVAADLDLPKAELSPASKGIPGLGLYINGKSSATVQGKPVDLSGNPGTGNLTQTSLSPVLASMNLHP